MISTNCYIVYKAPQGEENPCIIIDPGDNASYLAKLCRDQKLKPEAILLTHGHFDHMMAADELRRTFQIPILRRSFCLPLAEIFPSAMCFLRTYISILSALFERKKGAGHWLQENRQF
ncbi:MAG: MBL fold metallo-hydrolase [Lachnospiraceae bacterium]